MNKNKLGVNYILNLISSIFGIILPIITTPYVSRVLGAANIGVYSFTYSLITMFILIGALGTATHGQRIIARYQDNVFEKSKAFYEIFLLRAFVLTISLLVYFVVVIIYHNYFFYFLIQIPYFISAIFEITWFYQGNDDYKFITIRNIGFKILGLVFIFIFVKETGDLWKYLLILCSSQFLSNISMWPLLRKRIVKVSIKELKIWGHFRETMVYFIPTLAYQLYSLIDKVLLGFLSTEVETGFYEQAFKIITFATTILASYNVVVRTRMSYLHKNYTDDASQENKEAIDDTIRNSINIVLLLSCPIFVGVVSISSNLTGWFLGDEFDKVGLLLKIFGVMILLNSFRGLIGSLIFIPYGIQKKANIAQCAAALFNVASTAILIPILYSIGAIISSLLSEVIILSLYVVFSWKYVDYCYVLKKALKYLLTAILMGLSIFWIDHYLTGIICTLIQILAGCFVYFGILLLIKDNYVLSLLKRLFKKG